MDYFELIEDYLDDKLDVQTRKEFEQRLLVDAELKEQLENFPLLNKMGDSLLEEDIRATIKAIDQEEALKETLQEKSMAKQGVSGLGMFIRVAAVLLVLGICLSLFSSMKFSNSHLAVKHSADLKSQSLRSSDAEQLPPALGEDANQNIKILKSYLLKMPADRSAKMNLAKAYLEIGELDLSNQFFNDLLKTAQNGEADFLNWQLGLNRLAQKDETGRKQFHDKLKSKFYQDKLKLLESDLNSFFRKLSFF